MNQNKSGWLEYVRNYRFHSIFLKNTALIFGVIMLPFFCVLAISYYAYEHIYAAEEKAYADEIKTMIIKDIEDLFSEFQEKAILLSMDQDVQVFFYINDDRITYDFTEIQDYIELYRVSSNVMDDLYLYSPRSGYLYSSAGRLHYDRFFDQESIDRWRNTEGLQQYEYLDRDFYGMRKENVCLYYTIKYSAENRGVIAFLLNMNDLRKVFDYGEYVDLIIVGKQKVIYDSTNQRLGSEVTDVGEITGELDGGVVLSKAIDLYGLEIILHIDRGGLDGGMNKIGTSLVLFSCIMLVVSVAIGFYLSQKVLNPLTDILRLLKEKSSNYEQNLLQNKNELGFIINSINDTMVKKENVEAELLERIRLLKKAQAVALQAQINPHFINNTLENLNWMVTSRLGNGNDISEILNCLSSLMRVALGDSDTFVTLSDEIGYVKKYLFIQQKRLENSFSVIWDVDKALEDCKVIRLILQPVVENAINYGIKPYGSNGKIEIKAHRVDDRLKITVKDSGWGLTAQEVEKINDSIRKKVIKESNHIGLSNVNQRLILAFGEAYGVTVSSKIYEGTSVVMELPYFVSDQENGNH